MDASRANPPFRRIGPEIAASPVIISVPHAGRSYSEALLKASRLSRSSLETLEDRLVDRLVWRAVAAGATALIADAPRAEIDLNRDEREIDPAIIFPAPSSAALIQSPRSRGGLGLIPSRLARSGPIWRSRISAAELQRRLETIYRPYHAELGRMLEAARSRFGVAILLDCHSMPARGSGTGEASIVIGDRHGTSCAAEYVEAAGAAVHRAGFGMSLNAPYAGGYITARHGRPGAAVHALQIEIDRALYLDPAFAEPGPGFDEAARLVADVAEALAEAALGPSLTIAAE